MTKKQTPSPPSKEPSIPPSSDGFESIHEMIQNLDQALIGHIDSYLEKVHGFLEDKDAQAGGFKSLKSNLAHLCQLRIGSKILSTLSGATGTTEKGLEVEDTYTKIEDTIRTIGKAFEELSSKEILKEEASFKKQVADVQGKIQTQQEYILNQVNKQEQEILNRINAK